ncbi:MAG: hypothetical protein QM765_35830 [Myxococcales bacterium]
MRIPRHPTEMPALAAMAASLLAACFSPVTATPGTTDGGTVADGGTDDSGLRDAGTPVPCRMDPGGALLTNLAEANSDEDRPGPPAIAAGPDRFLVVVPRMVRSPKASSLVAALVAKDRTVEKELTLLDKLDEPIGVDVASDGAGYLVVFGAQSRVAQGLRLSRDGSVVAGPFAITTETVSSWPVVAFGGGTYLVVYGRSTSTYDASLFARRISPTGDVSEEISISEAKRNQFSPAVSYDGTSFLVVWQDERNQAGLDENADIYAARVSPDGTVLDPSGIAICTAPGEQRHPHAAFDGTRNIVVWFDATEPHMWGEGNVRGARLGTDGVLDGLPEAGGFGINTGPGYKDHPRALRFGQGTLVAWGSTGFSGNGGAGIFGAHLGPDGTVLDDAPGETGLILSGQPMWASRSLFPATATLGGQGMMVWLDNIELAGEAKSVFGAVLCPF